jgi:hypothetical protein
LLKLIERNFIMSEESKPEFRKEEKVEKKSFLSNKISMVQNFASAIASRGFSDNKVTKPVKQLRVLSCFGNEHLGGVLPPCEHLKNSSTEGKHFCGGCGCGDRKGTWLVAEGDEYSKLDYPKLACPLQMPGFTNYEKSKSDEGIEPITRRYYIENMSYKDVDLVPVTVHNMPLPVTPNKEEQGDPSPPPPST